MRTAAAALLLLLTTGEGAELRWVVDPLRPEAAIAELTGLDPEEVQQILHSPADRPAFSAHVEPDTLLLQPNLPPMLATLELMDGGLRLVPRFPLTPGMRYAAVYRPMEPDAAAQSVTHICEPKPRNPSTGVAAVHPIADQLPANVLKFYLHFSAPMSRGGIYPHVRIIDEAGKALELPFLELEEELWNADQTRITLLLDPGRIKRGLVPREEAGPVFVEGRTYTLEIASDWLDAARQPLVETFRKTFHIGPDDTIPPDPQRWKLETPTSGTREPLTLHFNEPMDSALVARLITVTLAEGPTLAGSVELTNADLTWQFTPDVVWPKGSGKIRIDALVEDLAGNQIGKAFDVDTFNNESLRAPTDETVLTFELK